MPLEMLRAPTNERKAKDHQTPRHGLGRWRCDGDHLAIDIDIVDFHTGRPASGAVNEELDKVTAAEGDATALKISSQRAGCAHPENEFV